jgi:uncharacterized membrane protein
VKRSLLAQGQANFLAGLAIVLPGVISVAVVLWLFRTVGNITDTLLIFLPQSLTHEAQGTGPMYWYWSLAAFVLAVCLICGVGLLARNYFGKRIIEWVDMGLLRVPLLNKIYATIKQVNEAFSSRDKTTFRTVVLLEWPRPGMHSLGFLTCESVPEVRLKTGEKMLGVFVPTTPNPTSGFLVFVPEEKVTKLDMSVADGIKHLVSLGTVVPESALPVLATEATASIPGVVNVGK